MRKYALIVVLLLCACASGNLPSKEYYLSTKGLNDQPTQDNFQHCHGYGCKYVTQVSLSKKEWRAIKKPMQPRFKNAQQERNAIKEAIARFEQIVGSKTGTHSDHWGTFQKTGAYQQDCVDESTNTTIYMTILEQANLLRFHKVEGVATRLPLINSGRWPHQTAVIREIETGKAFVVDSWFHDNGFPPEILPLTEWKSGWKPQEHKENKHNPP